jgi:hypothetical protein
VGYDAHRSSSNSWWEQQLSQQQLQALRQLATQPDRKEEQPKKEASSSPVPLPDAEDCDEAIEHYARARSSYQRLTPPSTYRTASQRVMDLVTAGLKGTVLLLGWVVRLPVKLARLATWSRDDWSAWWAKTKKTVKDEAHHYWVRARQQGQRCAVAVAAYAWRCLGSWSWRLEALGMSKHVYGNVWQAGTKRCAVHCHASHQPLA